MPVLGIFNGDLSESSIILKRLSTPSTILIFIHVDHDIRMSLRTPTQFRKGKQFVYALNLAQIQGQREPDGLAGRRGVAVAGRLGGKESYAGREPELGFVGRVHGRRRPGGPRGPAKDTSE